MLKLFLAPVPLNMSLNLLGIRRAVFTESSTFSCTTLLLVKYLDNSLDLLYNLGNPYVCASTSVLCRTRRRPGRTKDDVSPAHNQASRIGASAFRYLHTYVSYRQCCEFLGDGKRQHFSATLEPYVHVSVSSTTPTRCGILPTISETPQLRVFFHRCFSISLLPDVHILHAIRAEVRATYITDGIAKARETMDATQAHRPRWK
mmetsp:Transcript_963/g.6058  ORF Transcript_963/g.6058 Transcript_963/m.6058 type:complete len:203 (-) Transcript_963:113-721(-)